MARTTPKQPFHRRDLSQRKKYRALGALLGSAIGDALGAPFEFKPGKQYSLHFPEPVLGGTGEMVGGGSFGWAPGEFTDDTQMAIALAESLVHCGGYEPAEVFLRFRAWAVSAADIGNTTRAALRHKDHNDAAESAHHATGGRSASNGCVMRIAPVGVHGVTLGMDGTVALAASQARLTHFDPAAAAGAAIVAEIIRRVILTGDFEGVAAAVVSELSGHPELGPAVSAYAALVADDFDPHAFEGPGNGSVWTTVAQALWAVRTTRSFHDAMVAVIDLGGDTDTVAAVAGAVAGALYGLQGIPVRWATYVHGSVRRPDGSLGEYRMQDLINLGRRLLGGSDSSLTWPEPAAGPGMVDPEGVYAANLDGAALAPVDHAVVSMCITEDRFLQHPRRRTVVMIDKDNSRNPGLFFVVKEAVDAVDAFLAEGVPVVVHCHGGHSRTGLVLKAWYMRKYGADHDQARKWLADSWEPYREWNDDFMEFLEETWTHHLATMRADGEGA